MFDEYKTIWYLFTKKLQFEGSLNTDTLINIYSIK